MADRTRVSQTIRAQGCTVLEAKNYSDALAAFDSNPNSVSLLITDVALPDGNGCALALALRKRRPDLRVLFVSFQVGSELFKYYGLRVPNLHFLKKPFEKARILR